MYEYRKWSSPVSFYMRWSNMLFWDKRNSVGILWQKQIIQDAITKNETVIRAQSNHSTTFLDHPLYMSLGCFFNLAYWQGFCIGLWSLSIVLSLLNWQKTKKNIPCVTESYWQECCGMTFLSISLGIIFVLWLYYIFIRIRDYFCFIIYCKKCWISL